MSSVDRDQLVIVTVCLLHNNDRILSQSTLLGFKFRVSMLK